ncbi:hypothetical protein, partial [Glutamicibacter sp. V16R2B1]|uniref:hypothetical protein n=1 Tax=Glutamicibacter sp. V16R2B1 TaxID=2036207 RepID=UPI001284B70A
MPTTRPSGGQHFGGWTAPTRPPRGESRRARGWQAAATHLGQALRRARRVDIEVDPRRDRTALGLLVATVITVVAVWFRSGGPPGAGLAGALRTLIGVFAAVIPVLTFAGMWQAATMPANGRTPTRKAVGWLLLALGTFGTAHLIHRRSGGSVGQMAAAAPVQIAGHSLAGLILLGCGGLGLLLVAGQPI